MVNYEPSPESWLGYLTTHVPAPTPKQLFYNGSLQHTVAMQEQWRLSPFPQQVQVTVKEH